MTLKTAQKIAHKWRDPERLTAKRLNQGLDECEEARSCVCQELIAAGRGHARGSDIAQGTDDLSRAYAALAHACMALGAERDSRHANHYGPCRFRPSRLDTTRRDLAKYYRPRRIES